MRPRRIRAQKITVEANKVVPKGLNMQTGNHEAQNASAEGDVRVTVEKPTFSKGGNDSYPPKGTVLRSDKAVVNAKKINRVHPVPGKKKRRRFTAEKDVTVVFSNITSKLRRSRK